MTTQLDMFTSSTPPTESEEEIKEERAAILEHDAGYCRGAAEATAGTEFPWTNGHDYLIDMIADKEPLVHLVGNNPHTCQALSFAGYEHPCATSLSWVKRDVAVTELCRVGYRLHCRVNGQNGEIETWRLEG